MSDGSWSLTALSAGDPATLGRWRVRGRLGSGGMGVVYLGTDGPEVAAVKTVHAQLLEDPGFRQRFAREAAAVRSVSSPRVAALIEAQLERPPAFLAFGYVPGPTLAARVAADGPLTGEELTAFAAALADAIATIHAAGITHRDVKPANVICTPDGPVVIDFGIAMVAEATSLTATGLVVGSAGWMAPEQATGAPVGPPCDVFSWGATVAFAATGNPPFGVGRSDAIAYRVVHGSPDLTDLPTGLADVVEGALAKDPARRPTARQLRSRLLPAGSDETVAADVVTAMVARSWTTPLGTAVAPVATVATGAGPTTSRRRLLGAVVAAALVVALVAFVATRDSGGEGSPESALDAGATTEAPTTSTTEPTTTTAAPTTTIATTVLSATERVLYQPWSSSGVKSDLEVAGQTSGSCWSGSSALWGRSDAWRCATGDSLILDPCISSPFGTSDYVICPEGGPWGGVQIMNLTEGLPYDMANTTSEDPRQPWAVQIEGADRCILLQGATGSIGDRRINYACESGLYILGGLDTGDGISVYNALVDDESNSNSHWVLVERIWE